jgi:serine phosphatase RsbU (regulator of sigma subunit)
VRFEERTRALEPGDKIAFFTDGLFECQSPANAQWGSRAMTASFTTHGRGDITALRDGVIGDAFGFFGARPIDDDVTLVVLDVAAPQALALAG